MTPEEFRKAACLHADWIADYFEHVREFPVLPSTAPGDVTAVLPASAPEHGESIESIFGDFKSQIFPNLTLWNHPRFCGYFSISATPPSVLAEFLSAAMNVNAMLWRTSPAATELEQVTVGWLRQCLGLPESFFGLIYDTASTGVMEALASAREWIAPECRTEGMRNDLTVYISEQTHSSAEKGAILLGFGQKNVRKIAVDSEFRMRADALRAAIQADVARGLTPCCIVASVGSTSTSAIDPVSAIADIAEEYGAWLHVDAAYAGPAAVVPEMRWILDGAERAQSVLVNPHKWLFVGVDCSVLYTRIPEALRQSTALTAEYLKTSEDGRVVNLMEYGVQLGRRFRALKLWYVFRFYGRDGIVALLRKQMELAHEFQKLVESDPDFELAAPVPFSLVCFRHRGGDDINRRLLEAANASGEAFLSHTVLNGKYVLRCAIGNFQTEREDVRAIWELIRTKARESLNAEAR